MPLRPRDPVGPDPLPPAPRRRAPGRLRGASAALVLLALGLLGPGVSGAAAAGHGPKKKRVPPPVEVSLTSGLTVGPGVALTSPPVGLSLEYPVMAQALGGGPCPPPALTAELQRLGSPALELAGQSQDFTVPAGAPPSPAANWEALTSYALPGEFWTRLHCLLSATHEPLTVGLNARIGQLSWAEQMVAGARSAATNGLDFSLGNEPDLYYLPNYSSLGKPQPGEEAIAVGKYLLLAAALRPALGEAGVIGPELSTPAHWRTALPGVIATLHPQTVGVHMYPLTTCRTPRAATINGLLSASVGDAPRRLAWVVAAAAAANLPAIISEANSVSCGGKPGVSDGPAAAVWATRFVLSALKTGFRQVRFHFSGDPYDPFLVRGAEVLKRPLESALAALSQWLPLGATLRTVAVRGFQASSAATPSGRLLILDNETGKPQPVVIRGALSLRVQTLSAITPGLGAQQLRAARARIRIAVPANGVVAVSPAP